MTLLCWALGLMALISQPHALPAEFREGALSRGQPSVDQGPSGPYFIGLEWICDPGPADQGLTVSEAVAEGISLDEICYAGLELGFDDAEGLVTGP